MNRYLTLEKGESEPAHSYYGRVDSVEVIDNQGAETLIQLDAVAARSFDEDLVHGVPFRDPPLDRLQLAVLEFSTLNVPQSLQGRIREIARPGAWLLVERAPGSAATVDVDYYPGLFADGVTLASNITPVDENLAITLSIAFSFDDLEDARESDIAKLLEKIPPPDFISVYDVGQGNLNGLWTSGGGARLYYDFGGAVTANRPTFPKKPGKLCFAHNPTVVLSHWDWDHWSSAGRHSQILDSHWIVPRCVDPGVHHRALAWDLHRRGHLHIWPRGMAHYDGRAFRIERCSGSGRNDSGLAMIVHGEESTQGRREVLLTGDAAYDCIPAVTSTARFGAVVASHHGAIVDAIRQVKPAAPGSALVYSVGNGNQFCHPRLHAELEYLTGGWAPRDTYATSQRVRKRPNAIAIRLSGRNVATGCGDCTPKLIC